MIHRGTRGAHRFRLYGEWPNLPLINLRKGCTPYGISLVIKHKNDNLSRPVCRGLDAGTLADKGVHAQYCNSMYCAEVAAAPLWNEERSTRRRPRRVAALLVLHDHIHGAGKPGAEHGVITRGGDHIHGALRTSSRSSSSKRVRMASTTRESTTTHSRASSAKTSWRG